MDNLVLGLSVSIAVVLIFLMTSWKDPNKNSVNGMHNHPKNVEVDNNILNESEFGTGVQNRKMEARQADLAGIESYDDYNSVAQYMSIEPEVYASHNNYTNDINSSTTGPSTLSVTDHPNDINPWLVRKPFYHDAFPQPGARVESSEYPDQMRKKTFYPIG